MKGARWKPRQTICAACTVALLFISTYCSAGESITIREKTVIGTELRCVIETSVIERPFMAHSSNTKDVKGYVAVVDLSSNQPIEKRSRIYGPLWDIPQPRSTISFDAAVNFTKADVE